MHKIKKEVVLRKCQCGKKVPWDFRFCPWCRYKPYRRPSPDEEVLDDLKHIIFMMTGKSPEPPPCPVPHDKLKEKSNINYCPDCGSEI